MDSTVLAISLETSVLCSPLEVLSSHCDLPGSLAYAVACGLACVGVCAPASRSGAGARALRFLDLSKNNLHRKITLSVGSVF